MAKFWLFSSVSEVLADAHGTPYHSLGMLGEDIFTIHAIILSRNYKTLNPGRH